MPTVEIALQADDFTGNRLEHVCVRSAPARLFPQLFDRAAAGGKELQAYLFDTVNALWNDVMLARPWVCVACRGAVLTLATKMGFQQPAEDPQHVMRIIIKAAPICGQQPCLRQAEEKVFPEYKTDKAQGSESVKACNRCGMWDTAVLKNLKKCSRCKAVSYCSRACQKQDWPQHKLTCQQAPG